MAHYPKGVGHFSDLAELRLKELDAATPAAATPAAVAPGSAPPGATPQKPDLAALKSEDATKATEDALALTPEIWRVIQTHLTQLGFSTSGADGVPGDGTRRAIANWQTARDYRVSGFFNKPQLDALNAEPTVAAAPAPAPRAAPAPRTAVAARSVSQTRAPTARNGPANGPAGVFLGIGHGIGVGIGAAIGCKLTGC